LEGVIPTISADLKYLKMVERCAICGEPYGHFRVDDAASWLTILVVGKMTVPIILLCELSFQLPLRQRMTQSGSRPRL